jgi:hypothetical protein
LWVDGLMCKKRNFYSKSAKIKQIQPNLYETNL